MEIKIRKNGPYLVTKVERLIDHEGNVIAHEEIYALCRCGQSQNKPFCDGSHKRVGFNDEA